MKQIKEERDFFQYFDAVEIVELEQETWGRYIVPISRYEYEITRIVIPRSRTEDDAE